jgi:hypothetical protein
LDRTESARILTVRKRARGASSPEASFGTHLIAIKPTALLWKIFYYSVSQISRWRSDYDLAGLRK